MKAEALLYFNFFLALLSLVVTLYFVIRSAKQKVTDTPSDNDVVLDVDDDDTPLFKDTMVKPTPVAEYEELKDTDFVGNEIGTYEGESIDDLKKRCTEDTTCVGFSSEGVLRSKMFNQFDSSGVSFFRKNVV